MHTPTLQQLIDETAGKFFSIKFLTKDGRERVVNGKDKYNALLKGGVSTLKNTPFTSFVDTNANGRAGGWKAAKTDNLVEFRCGAIRQVCKVD
jgi:hypothetical protein